MKRRSRRHRRARRNSWRGHSRLHRKAARKGWRGARGRRSRRRTRRNAGSLVHSTRRAATRALSLGVLRRGTTILAGNVGTTFFTEKANRFLPSMLTSNPIGQVATLAAVAMAQSALVSKVVLLRKALNPNDILIGGMLAAVTRAARLILPGTFATCGLGEDLDGLGDWMATAGPGGNIANAFSLRGYASPQALMIGTHGIGDYAQIYQTQPPVVITALDGMADYEVQREIAAQM